MSGRNARLRAVPRPLRYCVTFGCVMLVLGLGDQAANWSHMPAAWARTLWPKAHAGTLPRFHYTSASRYYDETVAGIPLRCRQYVAPGHVVAVCVVRTSGGPKA